MKKYIYSLIALFMVTLCSAQMFISQAEYFWDTDPGAGNGTAVLAADGTFNSAFEQLTKTGITLPSNGLHKFNIRIKDNTGVWGPVFSNIINVQQAPTATAMFIAQAEYFWDTDPGQGNGTAVLAADGAFDNAFEQLTKTGIALPSAGLHVFNIRIKDNTGVWGPVFRNVIEVQAAISGCFQSIASGADFSMGIKTDNSLFTWGNNSAGNLGDGTSTSKNTPTQIGNAPVWKAVAGGSIYTLAIKTDGTLWGWGANGNGQLGLGAITPNVLAPTQIGTATNWKSLAAGQGNVVAIKTDGTLWAWGENSVGQLGDGTTNRSTVPIQIGTATNWKMVSSGPSSVVAVKTDGTLWAWGYNGNSLLGDGTTTNRSVPTQIGTATNWQSASCGFSHCIATRTDGSLWAWGLNTNGQLGDGTTTSKTVPTRIGTATDWRDIAAGYFHNLAIKTTGTLWSWGYNTQGQVGDGTATQRTAPVQIGTATNWKSVAVGSNHSFALKLDGSSYSWGLNNNGQLGDGTNTNRNTPTLISCPTSLLSTPEIEVAKAIKMYPNPVKDILTLSFESTITAAAIYNVLGQEVITKAINATEGTIDVSALTSGTYFVKIYADGLTKTMKVIKE